MTKRYSQRIRDIEELKFKTIIKELNDDAKVFRYSNYYFGITQKYRAEKIRKIYLSILKNIKLFHKYFPQQYLKTIFEILTTKGYEILHYDTNNKNIEKIVEKPILDMVTYIHKYNGTISNVSYKLSKQMNKDVGLTIMSYFE